MLCDECGVDDDRAAIEICAACGEQFCEECYDGHECEDT